MEAFTKNILEKITVAFIVSATSALIYMNVEIKILKTTIDSHEKSIKNKEVIDLQFKNIDDKLDVIGTNVDAITRIFQDYERKLYAKVKKNQQSDN